MPTLHRYWYARFLGKAWPETQPLQEILLAVRQRAARGDLAGGLDLVGRWWRAYPIAARALWVGSYIVTLLCYALLAVGFWRARRQPAIAAAFGLIVVYLTVLPGPLAYYRFLAPAIPLCAVLMCLAFGPIPRESAVDRSRDTGTSRLPPTQAMAK